MEMHNIRELESNLGCVIIAVGCALLLGVCLAAAALPILVIAKILGAM